MATVTSPILTDATFATKMDALAAAVKPDASDIPLTPPSGMTATNVQDGFSEIKQSLSDLAEHEYIVTRWVTFSYFNASQLEGTYSVPTVPSGYSVRLLGCMPTFANNAMGAKFSGKFLSSTGNKLRALGSGFVSGDSESFLVLFLVYKS